MKTKHKGAAGMRYCCIKNDQNQQKIIPIIKEVFETETKREPPFYQIKNERNLVFALCPACGNPIQIIGFYKDNEKPFMDNPKKPFGRHYCKDIEKIGKHNQTTYEMCPYRRKKHYIRTEKRAGESLTGVQIRLKFIEHFDKVVHVAQKSMEIRYGEGIIKKMLLHYKAWEAWQYTGATLENIPWTFLYMSDSQQLYGQYIKKGGYLHRELKKKKYEAILTSSGDFVKFCGFTVKTKRLKHFFTKHISTPNDGKINEHFTAMFVITDEILQTPDIVVLEKIIYFDHDYFFNLLHYEKWDKNEQLLKLAYDTLHGRVNFT